MKQSNSAARAHPKLKPVSAALALLATCPALGYDIADRWTSTQTDGGGIQRGDAITLNWSIVPDGETYSRGTSVDLIEYLDDGWNVAAIDRTPDLTNRVWFAPILDAYDQYGYVSGITMVYVPEQNPDGSDSGLFGDIRIGGDFIDGPGGVLANNSYPNNGDMKIDTGRNSSGNPVNHTSVSSLRNLISHESGHGVGIAHSDGITGANAVMEPFLQTGFFGLQFDDIYAFNRNYGDPLEKGGGNDSFSNATNLGALMLGSPIARGTDANDAVVAKNDDDWVGIDGNSDIDYFRFSLAGPSRVDLVLTPQGPTYTTDEQGPNTNFAAQADLNLKLYNGAQSLVTSVDTGNAGQAEAINNLELAAGDYYLVVDGEADLNQFYRLDLSVIDEVVPYQLVYHAGTGEIEIDTKGGSLINYVIEGSGFVEQRHERIFANGTGSSLDGTLSESDGSLQGISGVFSLGAVLEPGLDESAFESRITTRSYVPGLGEPVGQFDLVIDDRYAVFYNAATGELTIDTRGGTLINYVLEGSGFQEENHTFVFLGGLGSSTDSVLSESSLLAGSGVLNMGAVLPTLLTPAELEAIFTKMTYVTGLSMPVTTFDLGFIHLPGDTDLDVDIDDADLAVVFSNYAGPGIGSFESFDGDVDGDGDVDDADLAQVFSGYTGPRSASVPEPASAVGLLIVGALAARRRR